MVPKILEVAGRESNSLLMRCVTSAFDCWTGPQGKATRRVWEIAKVNERILGCSTTVDREHYAQVLQTGGFSRGVASPCHHRAIFSKNLETYILVHGDDFNNVGRQVGRRHALSLLRGAYKLSKVVTLGPESSQSQTASFLGKTLTLRQWESSTSHTSSMYPAP